MRKHGERGQTFPEMMAVVAIIAILAAVIIANLQHARVQAQINDSQSALESVATAMELYYSQNGAFPPDLGGSAVTPTEFGGAGNPYMTSTPKDGAGGSIAYWVNGYGIPAGVFQVGTTSIWDCSLLTPQMSYNLYNSGNPTNGEKCRIIYSSTGQIYANGPI